MVPGQSQALARLQTVSSSCKPNTLGLGGGEAGNLTPPPLSYQIPPSRQVLRALAGRAFTSHHHGNQECCSCPQAVGKQPHRRTGWWAEVPTPRLLQENGAPLIRDEILGTRPCPTDRADAPSVVEGGWADELCNRIVTARRAVSGLLARIKQIPAQPLGGEAPCCPGQAQHLTSPERGQRWGGTQHPGWRLSDESNGMLDPLGVKPLPDRSGKAQTDHAAHCPAPDEDPRDPLGSGQCCPGHWTGRASQSRTWAPLPDLGPRGVGPPRGRRSLHLGPVTG